jgi:hypothetical protein
MGRSNAALSDSPQDEGENRLYEEDQDMTDPMDETRDGSAQAGGMGSRFGRIGRFIVQNPMRTVQLAFFSLIAIVILQNLETTSIDVLFWSITALPKLVLIFLSMLIGAAAWELARRLMR